MGDCSGVCDSRLKASSYDPEIRASSCDGGRTQSLSAVRFYCLGPSPAATTRVLTVARFEGQNLLTMTKASFAVKLPGNYPVSV